LAIRRGVYGETIVMAQSDDEPKESMYRGVNIERRLTGSHVRDGKIVHSYSWIATSGGWLALTGSLEALHKAIDAHLDRTDSPT
jgi:hypothetical protein